MSRGKIQPLVVASKSSSTYSVPRGCYDDTGSPRRSAIQKAGKTRAKALRDSASCGSAAHLGYAPLFPKESLKGFSRVVGRGSSGRGLALKRHTRREVVALVGAIFFGDAGRNGLGTFEAGRGIKVGALFATVQLKAALRAFSLGIETGGQHGPA